MDMDLDVANNNTSKRQKTSNNNEIQQENTTSIQAIKQSKLNLLNNMHLRMLIKENSSPDPLSKPSSTSSTTSSTISNNSTTTTTPNLANNNSNETATVTRAKQIPINMFQQNTIDMRYQNMVATVSANQVSIINYYFSVIFHVCLFFSFHSFHVCFFFFKGNNL